MTRLLSIGVLAVFAVLLAACGGALHRSEDSSSGNGDQAASKAVSTLSGCGAKQAPGTRLESMRSGGIERTYRLHVPLGYDANRPTPLVLNFHGFASNAWEQEAYTRMPKQADASGFITVAPDGSGEPRRWNIYGRLEPSFVDDFAFTRELIDHLTTQLCIDAARIYATGMSNGGGMSSLLGCELNDRIAAIAPAAGSPYSMPACRGKDPMPVVAFHGTDDRAVPFEGGVAGRLGLAAFSVRENMRRWAQHNGCDMTLKSQRIAADVVLESYEGCRAGADVRLYVVEAGGHTWPGADDAEFLGRTTHSINATSIAWQFFAEHPKK